MPDRSAIVVRLKPRNARVEQVRADHDSTPDIICSTASMLNWRNSLRKHRTLRSHLPPRIVAEAFPRPRSSRWMPGHRAIPIRPCRSSLKARPAPPPTRSLQANQRFRGQNLAIAPDSFDCMNTVSPEVTSVRISFPNGKLAGSKRSTNCGVWRQLRTPCAEEHQDVEPRNRCE